MLVAPEFFAEVRHSHHAAMMQALEKIGEIDRDWKKMSGRECGGLLTVEGEPEVKVGIVAMGSTVGTLRAGMAHLAEKAGPAPIQLKAEGGAEVRSICCDVTRNRKSP